MTAEEAWGLAKELLVDGLTSEELKNVFGDEYFGIKSIFKLTPQEVKEKLDEHRRPKVGNIVRVKESGIIGFFAGINMMQPANYQVSIPNGDSRIVYEYKQNEIEKIGGSINFSQTLSDSTSTSDGYFNPQTKQVCENNMSAKEAWKLAIKLRYMDFEEKAEIFKLDPSSSKELWLEIMEKFSPEEVKQRLDNFENKNSIDKDDVVKINSKTGIVTKAAGKDGYFTVLFEDGSCGKYKTAIKTGRKIDTSEILKNIMK